MGPSHRTGLNSTMPMHIRISTILKPLNSLVPSRRARSREFSQRILLATFLLAAAVRLAYIATLSGDASFFAEPDTRVYWALGEHLRDTLLNTTDRLPLYPIFLAACRALFGDAPRAVAIVQGLLDAGTCVMIVRLALFISGPAGVAASVMAACSATLVIYSAQILTDTLALFLLTAAFLGTALFVQRPTVALSATAGLLAGLALATRPSVALLLPPMAAVMLFRMVKTDRRSGVICAALFCAASILPVAPTLIRNYVHFDRVALTSQSGDYLAFWIAPMLRQRQDGTPYETTVKKMKDAFDATARQAPKAYANPFDQSSLKAGLARAELSSISLVTFAKAWGEGAGLNLLAPAMLGEPRVREMKKPSFFGTPGTSLLERAVLYFKASTAAFAWIMVLSAVASAISTALAALGFAILVRTRPALALLAAVEIGYFLILTGPIGSPKYRLPMEPALIILAAVGIVGVFRVGPTSLAGRALRPLRRPAT